MCSTLEVRLAMLRAAIDEVAHTARADQAGHTDLVDLARRLAGLWAMIVELDPALAARLHGYGPDTGWDAPLCRHRAVITGQFPTISISMVAVTSGCSRTRTWCAPMVLIGLGTSIRRRSSSGPPAARTASAMSEGLTEPNSRPVLPALVASRTLSAPSRPAASLASSRPRISLADRARLIRSTCFSAPRVQRIARPRGTR